MLNVRVWEIAFHLAVAGDVFDALFLCCPFWGLIEIVSEGFLTYFFNTYECASVLVFLTFLFLFVFLRRNLNTTMTLGKCFCRTLTLINRYAGVNIGRMTELTSLQRTHQAFCSNNRSGCRV